MTKLLTPRAVAKKMLSEILGDIDYKQRLLNAAHIALHEINAALSDKPSEWVSVSEVELEDKRFYFVQRVIAKRSIGDVCLAEWRADYGWMAMHGSIFESHRSKADLLVLMPKGTQRGRKKKPKAKGKKPKR